MLIPTAADQRFLSEVPCGWFARDLFGLYGKRGREPQAARAAPLTNANVFGKQI